MATLKTKARQQQRSNDTAFPGDRISATALPPGSDIASIRSGSGDPLNCAWMLPCNRRFWASELASYREEAFDLTKPEDREMVKDLLRRSYKNREVSAEIAAYREFVLQHEILAAPFAFGAFQAVPLSDDELPEIITPKVRQYFNVRYMGNDGQARQDQWKDARSSSLLFMRRLTTDKIEYPLFDIQLGNINVLPDINAQLRFDMEMKLDVLAQAQLDANITDSGLRDLIQLHPLVVAANVPDKNHLDLTGTNPGILTLDKIKDILSLISQWGVDGLTPDGAFQISSMIISPQNIRDQWDYVDLVSGFTGGAFQPDNVVPTSLRDQIFQTGTMTQAWGYNWSTVPNSRLDKGKLYVFSTQPVGWYFSKPALDQVITWEGPDAQEKNQGQIVYNKVCNFAMPELWLHRYVVVDF